MKSIRLLVLDEADKLLEKNFSDQINQIFKYLPSSKQILALSATYPHCLAELLTKCMKNPQVVRLDSYRPVLHGVNQYFCEIPWHALPHKIFLYKIDKLSYILTKLPFHQCLVFSNYQAMASDVCSALNARGWPSIYIYGTQNQNDRIDAIRRMNDFSCRILISTDVTARGIDIENINLVVNLDLPNDPETYLHRIGRAGRFGSSGIAVNLTTGSERQKLFYFAKIFDMQIDKLPSAISNITFSNLKGIYTFEENDECNSHVNGTISNRHENSEKNLVTEDKDIVKIAECDHNLEDVIVDTPTQGSRKTEINIHQMSKDKLKKYSFPRCSVTVSKSFDKEYLFSWRQQTHQDASNGFDDEQKMKLSRRFWQRSCNDSNWRCLAKNASNLPFRNDDSNEFNAWYSAYMDGILWSADLSQYILSRSLSDLNLQHKYVHCNCNKRP